jgi:sulfur carrier protein ThiS
VTISVRVVQLGRGVVQYSGDDGVDVEATLTEVGLSVQGMEVRVNGTPAALDHLLRDGDLVTVIPMIKGGSRCRHRWRTYVQLCPGRSNRHDNDEDSLCGI